MVGDGYAMGVAAQVVQHILGATEGWFGVDHPLFSEQGPQPSRENLGVRKAGQISGEVKLATFKGRLETVDELAAEHTAEHRDGEKEARMGWNPVGVIEREPTGGDDTVDMGMNLELLVRSAAVVVRRVVASKAAGEWRVGD